MLLFQSLPSNPISTYASKKALKPSKDRYSWARRSSPAHTQSLFKTIIPCRFWVTRCELWGIVTESMRASQDESWVSSNVWWVKEYESWVISNELWINQSQNQKTNRKSAKMSPESLKPSHESSRNKSRIKHWLTKHVNQSLSRIKPK